MHQLKIHHQDDLVAAKGLFEMPSEYLKPFFCVDSVALRHCTELCFLPFNNRTILFAFASGNFLNIINFAFCKYCMNY